VGFTCREKKGKKLGGGKNVLAGRGFLIGRSNGTRKKSGRGGAKMEKDRKVLEKSQRQGREGVLWKGKTLSICRKKVREKREEKKRPGA